MKLKELLPILQPAFQEFAIATVETTDGVSHNWKEGLSLSDVQESPHQELEVNRLFSDESSVSGSDQFCIELLEAPKIEVGTHVRINNKALTKGWVGMTGTVYMIDGNLLFINMDEPAKEYHGGTTTQLSFHREKVEVI